MTPQVRTLLDHLQKHGSISQAEASTVYRIRALPRRIADLKDMGVPIKRELRNDPTGQRYARYFLDKPEEGLYVGAKVRIVDPWMPLGYGVGDVGTVVALSRTYGTYSPEVDFDNGQGPVYVSQREFEVIA